MNKEKEALLQKIKLGKDTPHNVSKQSLLRWLDRMKPQNEDMRSYLIAYFSAPTLKEKQVIKSAKLASLTASEQKVFLEQWWKCIENDMAFQQVQTAQ